MTEGKYHRWGLPSNSAGEPDDTIFDHLKGTPHWIHSSYCLDCKEIFCEHCLGIDMYSMVGCDGMIDESKRMVT